jgi:hypothetical protein
VQFTPTSCVEKDAVAVKEFCARAHSEKEELHVGQFTGTAMLVTTSFQFRPIVRQRLRVRLSSVHGRSRQEGGKT